MFHVKHFADSTITVMSSGYSQFASLLAHERSRFAICQWELSTPTDISIPLTRRLVLRALEAGECLSALKKEQEQNGIYLGIAIGTRYRAGRSGAFPGAFRDAR